MKVKIEISGRQEEIMRIMRQTLKQFDPKEFQEHTQETQDSADGESVSAIGFEMPEEYAEDEDYSTQSEEPYGNK